MPLWGVNMSWAHAVSKDLIHWLYLEVALEPDQQYDAMGVWSGSSTIGPNGIPFIIYTGDVQFPTISTGHYLEHRHHHECCDCF